MEHNLSKWLKDDLGLKHMSEADLNNLVYHPRHGSLCRRLVKFIVESTLCTRRYPNVYAKEEYEELKSEHEHKQKQVRQLLSRLETQLRHTKNIESELKFMAEKLKCLSGIEDMLRTTSEALEAMTRRPTLTLDEVDRKLENPHYLENQALENLYTSLQADYHQKLTLSPAPETQLTSRQLASVEVEYSNLINKAQIMHGAITKLLTSASEAIRSQSECDTIQLHKTNVEHLKALEMPPIEHLDVVLDEEEKHLLEERKRLVKELQESEQQVLELAQQYKTARTECDKKSKQSLNEDIAILKKLQHIELVIRQGDAK